MTSLCIISLYVETDITASIYSPLGDICHHVSMHSFTIYPSTITCKLPVSACALPVQNYLSPPCHRPCIPHTERQPVCARACALPLQDCLSILPSITYITHTAQTCGHLMSPVMTVLDCQKYFCIIIYTAYV